MSRLLEQVEYLRQRGWTASTTNNGSAVHPDHPYVVMSVALAYRIESKAVEAPWAVRTVRLSGLYGSDMSKKNG
jgi:hypothetical protein